MKTITKLRLLYPAWTIVGLFSLVYAPTLASETFLYKLGQLGQVTVQIFQIVIALLLYQFFEKTDKAQATMMLIFGLLGVPLSLMGIIMPEATHLAEIFWGLWLIPTGTLVIRSKMFPKPIGYFLYLGALGYLGTTVSFFLTGTVPAYIEALTTGELVWVLWICIRGAREA